MKLIYFLGSIIFLVSNPSIAADHADESFKMNDSPYPSQYEILDYGTGPGVRDFEVKDKTGRLVFADSYYDANDVIWVNGNYIIYPRAELNNKPTDAEAKQCRETTGGDNLTVYWQGYDLKTKTKKMLNIPAYNVCSQ